MLKLVEIQSHVSTSLVHHGFAASWSDNNQISMMTEKGIQILELRFNPHNKTSAIECARSSLETDEAAPTDDVGIDAVNILQHSALPEVSALLLNAHWAPTLHKTAPINRVPVQTVWSPRGVLHYGRCLLACLTNMGQLTLYGCDRYQWVHKFDISKIWLRYCRKNWSKPNKATHMKHQISELQYRAARVKYTAVAWERFEGDEYSCSTLLITASQDGIVGLWIVEDANYKSDLNLKPITISLSNGISVKLMKVFDSKLTNITSFLWCSIDSRSGVLIAGNFKGAINSVCINFCDTSKNVSVEKLSCDKSVASVASECHANIDAPPPISEKDGLEMQETDLQANSAVLVGDNQPNLTSRMEPNLESATKMETEHAKSGEVVLGMAQNRLQVNSGESETMSNLDSNVICEQSLGIQQNVASKTQSNETCALGSYYTMDTENSQTSDQQPLVEAQVDQISGMQPSLNSPNPSQTLVPNCNLMTVAQHNLTSEQQLELSSGQQPNLTPEAKLNPTSEAQLEPTSEMLPNLTSVPDPNLTSEAQPNPTSVPQPNPTSQAQANPTFLLQPNLTSAPDPNLSSEAEPNLTSEQLQPEITSGQRLYQTSEAQPNPTSVLLHPSLTSAPNPNLTSQSQPNLPSQPKPILTSKSDPPVKVEISVECLWPEEDLLSVSSLICWDADNNNVCAVCIKGTHIIVLILRKDNGKLVSKHCHNTKRQNLTGLIKLNNAAFLIGSQQGAIFKLTLVQDDNGEVTFLNETVQTNFIKNRYGVMGLAASRNRAFIAVNVSLNGPHDNAKLKTLSSFVITSFENTEIDPMSVVNSKNYVNLDRIWDCLENARLNILQKSITYIVPASIRDQLDTMDISPLIITMWLTHYVAYSLHLEEIESGLEFTTDIKSKTMTRLYEEIRLLVFASHIFQRCTLLLSSSSSSSVTTSSSSSPASSSSTSFLLLSLCLMRRWISSALLANSSVECHATTRLTAVNIVEQIDAYCSKQDGGASLAQAEVCVVCGSDVPAVIDFSVSCCSAGHQVPRCSLSLVQIPSDCVYLVCNRCGVLAHPQAVSGNFATCVFCNDQLTADHKQMTEEEVSALKDDVKDKRRRSAKGKWSTKESEENDDWEEQERIAKQLKRKKWKKKSK